MYWPGRRTFDDPDVAESLTPTTNEHQQMITLAQSGDALVVFESPCRHCPATHTTELEDCATVKQENDRSARHVD